MFRYLIFVVLLFSSLTHAHENHVIQICSEPWAPYFYNDPNHEPPTPIGIDIELLNAIASRTGLEFSAEVMPWSRCLKHAANFSTFQQQEMVADATYNDSRAQDFHFVGPLYEAPISLFYSTKAFPDGVKIPDTNRAVAKMEELANFKICGRLGWNYEIYTDKYGIPQDKIVFTATNTTDSVLKMLQRQRCQVFETQASYIAGEVALKTITSIQDIACQKLDQEPLKFYLLVSKQSPRAEQLVSTINLALKDIRQSGEYEQIVDKYLNSILSDSAKVLTKCM